MQLARTATALAPGIAGTRVGKTGAAAPLRTDPDGSRRGRPDSEPQDEDEDTRVRDAVHAAVLSQHGHGMRVTQTTGNAARQAVEILRSLPGLAPIDELDNVALELAHLSVTTLPGGYGLAQALAPAALEHAGHSPASVVHALARGINLTPRALLDGDVAQGDPLALAIDAAEMAGTRISGIRDELAASAPSLAAVTVTDELEADSLIAVVVGAFTADPGAAWDTQAARVRADRVRLLG